MTTQHRTTEIERANRGQAYLHWLRQTLDDKAQFRATNREIRGAVRDYAREHRAALSPSWARAAWVLTRTLAAVAAPVVATGALAVRGHGWAGFALVPVVAAALFGVMSIVHDAVHGTFVPSRRANRVLGTLLAPLVLLDFQSFRASHMAHHRHSQAMDKDPKRPLLPRPGEGGRAWTKIPIEGLLRAAKRLENAPTKLRHGVYLVTLLLLGLPTVVLFAGEISLRERDWRRPATWLSLVATLAIPVALALVSPMTAVFFVTSLWAAMGLFFGVFLTHISPYQLYMVDDNPSIPLFSLNVSDIDMGGLVGALGNTFTEYHASHHLLPYVPSYRLEALGRWVNERFADWKAPTFRLLVATEFNVIADSLVDNVVAERSTLIAWDTAVGEMRRLPRIEHEEEAPAPSCRFAPAA